MERTGTPWALYPVDAPGLVKEGPVFVKAFVFQNYTNPEHRCFIKDGKDRTVLDVRGATDFSPVIIKPACDLPFKDIFLWELQSGQLHIYIH